MHRILLLMATRTYKAKAFLRAARRLNAEVVVGSERAGALARRKAGTTLLVDIFNPEHAVAQVVEAARERPFDAIVGVDDDTTLIATMAAAELGLSGNSVESVRATRDKHLMRCLLRAAGARSPWFELASVDDDMERVAERLPYPVVLKPVHLSASRGVIRAGTPGEFKAAADRIRAILDDPEVAALPGDHGRLLLIEGFIPGFEVALEGMLTDGRLTTLALFDKPDPLDGPYFEETIYVTPSRLTPDQQAGVHEAVSAAAAAIGLREGPVHAEVRVNDAGAWVVEVAARSIGGLCSSALEFSGGRSLEELILLHAVGAEASHRREPRPSGVMMLPIPRAGVLRSVGGQEAVRATPGVIDLSISIPLGDTVQPLPEGNRYLGFLFARGDTIDEVEQTLRRAHALLELEIEPAGSVDENKAALLH